MDYLNIEELALACSRFEGPAMAAALQAGQLRQGIDLGVECKEWSLLEEGKKINERQVWKSTTRMGKRITRGPERWMFGEFKIFTAVTLLHSHAKATTLAQLNHNDAAAIQAIFQHKSLQFVSYELACLIHSRQKPRKLWSPEEEALLQTIISKNSEDIEWRTISVQLFSESKGTFFRGQKDCRERWRNYLDPKVLKDAWTEEEDEKLMRLVEDHGFRWSYISRKFHGRRTEHMVKNRYNSFIKNWRTKQQQKSSLKPKKERGVPGKQKGKTEKETRDYPHEDQVEQSQLREEPLKQPTEAREQAPISEAQVALQVKEKEQRADEQDDQLCSQFIEKRIQQTSSNNHEKFLKRTNDEEQLCNHPDQLLLPWHSHDGNAFSNVFSMAPELQRTAINEVVAALGCSHFEAMLDSYEQEEGTFDWLSE